MIPLAIEGVKAGAQILNTGLGMITDRQNNIRQFNQGKEMMGLQQANQMQLNQQAKDLSLQQWKDTNYSAQKAEMEKAGLNVGMMYGMSGGGGTTAQTGSGGSASMAQAPQAPKMDINILGQMAQLELMKAQTKKTEAEATQISGVGTDKTIADTALTNMNAENAKIQNEINSKSLENVLDTIKANRDKAVADSTTANTTANVSATTQNEQIERIKNESIISAIKIGAEKQGIKLSEAQVQNMIEQVKIGKYNAEKVGTDAVLGKQLNSLIEKIYDYFGVKNETMK